MIDGYKLPEKNFIVEYRAKQGESTWKQYKPYLTRDKANKVADEQSRRNILLEFRVVVGKPEKRNRIHLARNGKTRCGIKSDKITDDLDKVNCEHCKFRHHLDVKHGRSL
jgi:hypothetical protein